MKQCIAEVLETQSEIIQLQRNVIDRLAAALLQHGMIEEEELAMMQQAADLQKQFLCNVVGFVPPLPERLGDDHFGCGELQPPLKRATCQIIIGKNINVNALMNPRILRVVFFNAGRAIAAQLGKMH